MAEFEKVRGQIEGLWDTEVKNAELEGRKAGAAAAVEAVWQAGHKLAGEWDEERAPLRTYKSFLQELKQSVGGAPALLLSPEEWERVLGALGQQTLTAEGRRDGGIIPVHHMTDAELEAWRQSQVSAGADERPGFRVGDTAAPLPGSAQAQADADWQERGVDLAKPEGATHQADWSATGEALRQADLEREADAEKEAHRLADLPPAERSAL